MHPTSLENAMLIVPCFNESSRIDLLRFRQFSLENPWVRLVFVDDGSTDETSTFIESYFSKFPELKVDVIRLVKNAGKSEAVRQGILHCRQYSHFAFGYIDADLATPLAEIKNAFTILQRRVDVSAVVGSRLTLAGHKISRTSRRRFASRLLAFAVSTLLRIQIKDTQCGAKVFRNNKQSHEIFSNTFRDRWLFDIEVFLRAEESNGNPNYLFFEMPLENWKEIDGTKIRLTEWLESPLKLLKIFLHYRCNLGVADDGPQAILSMPPVVCYSNLREQKMGGFEEPRKIA